MTPAQLTAAGEALYGPGWKSAIADLLGVDYRRIKHWLDGTRPIPAIEAELAAELRRRGKQALALADRLERK
jgi:DNA-binding transcriptional regulator YdaS (Cro superfamily)